MKQKKKKGERDRGGEKGNKEKEAIGREQNRCNDIFHIGYVKNLGCYG